MDLATIKGLLAQRTELKTDYHSPMEGLISEYLFNFGSVPRYEATWLFRSTSSERAAISETIEAGNKDICISDGLLYLHQGLRKLIKNIGTILNIYFDGQCVTIELSHTLHPKGDTAIEKTQSIAAQKEWLIANNFAFNLYHGMMSLDITSLDLLRSYLENIFETDFIQISTFKDSVDKTELKLNSSAIKKILAKFGDEETLVVATSDKLTDIEFEKLNKLMKEIGFAMESIFVGSSLISSCVESYLNEVCEIVCLTNDFTTKFKQRHEAERNENRKTHNQQLERGSNFDWENRFDCNKISKRILKFSGFTTSDIEIREYGSVKSTLHYIGRNNYMWNRGEYPPVEELQSMYKLQSTHDAEYLYATPENIDALRAKLSEAFPSSEICKYTVEFRNSEFVINSVEVCINNILDLNLCN